MKFSLTSALFRGSRNAPSLAWFFLLAALFVACSDSSSITSSNERKVRVGSWGGDHVVLTITNEGGALEYDCAAGTIDEPFVVDAGGRFDLRGTHVRGHGGPIRVGEEPDRHPARYTGRIDGNRMTLTVMMTDLDQSVGTFTLIFGASPRIVKCL